MMGEMGATELNSSALRSMLETSGALGGAHVDVIDTHAAVVFVGTERALKIKRRVRYDYLDFSTLTRRHAALLRELEINKPQAADIYERLAALTRQPDGGLALDGTGEVVEWGLLMRRFAQRDVLAARIREAPLPSALVKQLAEAVARYHAAAPVVTGIDGPARISAVIHELKHAFARLQCFEADETAAWAREAETELDRCRPLLTARAASGHVRRCHGDLHLGNIVLWNGEPTPFDAIEFDEALAVIDTLYDLAFLIMDLDERGAREAANTVLNRYVWRSTATGEAALRSPDQAERTAGSDDLDALAALPLLLACRAGIRAMVTAQRAALRADGDGGISSRSDIAVARRYLAASLAYLRPEPARLIAVGGLSGTGKSTLAAELAPAIGRAPGAIHLRSDLERKAMAGVGETERLPAESYTQAASAAVYARLYDKAARALRAGQAVVVDAVFARAEEQVRISAVAADCGVPFRGLWLTAPAAVREDRVARRTGDASDATVDVVRQQAEWTASACPWDPIDASGPSRVTFDRACLLLALESSRSGT